MRRAFCAGRAADLCGSADVHGARRVLDIITYGFRNLLVLFAPGKHKHQHYYDYKMAKEANRGKGTHAPLVVGLAFILLAGVCLIFYYYGI